MLPKFDYQAPNSISDACSLLTQAQCGVAIMAGGTDLLIQMKNETLTPQVVIGLRKIEQLQGLSYSETEGLSIGSMVSLQTLVSSELIRGNFPMLADAASSVGAIQHRFMGTVGGNLCLDTRCLYYNQPAEWRRCIPPCHKLGGNRCHAAKGVHSCHAVYSADVGSALLALDARVKITNGRMEKVISLEDFFSGDPVRPTNLQRNELVKEIIVPAQKPTFGRYYKLRQRRAIDFMQLGIAIVRFSEKNYYRIVIAGVEAKPLRFKHVEEMLSHERISENLIAAVLTEIASKVKPVANISGSPIYRRKMVGIIIKKAFIEMGLVL